MHSIHSCVPNISASLRILESQNGLGGKGPLEAIQPNPPATSRDIFNWIRLLRAPSNLAWNVSRDGASTTSQSLPSSSDTYSTLLHLEELLLLLKIFFFSSPSTHNFLCDHHCCDFTARSSLLTLHVHHSRLPGCRLLPLPRQRKTLSCTTNETSWCLDTLFLLNSSNKHLIQDGTS